MPNNPITVAVGVIINHQNQVLIARRPKHAHQGNLWEFPGGKVEPQESIFQALQRELQEELDIEVKSAIPFTKIQHQYNDKSVNLDVWIVESFIGTPIGKEAQPIKWVELSQLSQFDFPEANQQIIERLSAASIASQVQFC